jgi:hypothetical protein
MAKLVELDVEEQTACHGQDQGGIKKNQSRLTNVGVIEQNQPGGNYASRNAIARFPHDEVRYRYSQGAQNGGESSESHVGHLVIDVGIANVIEVEVAIVADQPTHEGEQKLGKGRVHVEEVGAFEIV